jgi:hypothetical protein
MCLISRQEQHTKQKKHERLLIALPSQYEIDDAHWNRYQNNEQNNQSFDE